MQTRNEMALKSFIGGMQKGLALMDPNHELHANFRPKDPVNPQNSPLAPIPKVPMTLRKMGT